MVSISCDTHARDVETALGSSFKTHKHGGMSKSDRRRNGPTLHIGLKAVERSAIFLHVQPTVEI
jgi:hypothetical protein